MAEFPAMPLFTDAYLGDTIHLSTTEHGAYLLLLIVEWRTKDCSLPNDEKLLAKYARLTRAQWRRVAPAILPFFTLVDGRLVQLRLRDEFNHVRQVRAKRAAAGHANSLKTKGRHLTLVPHVNNICTTPTPTPTPTPLKKEREDKSSPKKEPLALPDWLPVEAWEGWLEMRKRKSVPNTARALQLAITKLDQLRRKGFDPAKLLDEHTMRGWHGIYEPGGQRGDDMKKQQALTL